MYLKRDINGQASGIKYGKMGDEVLLLNTELNREMVLVENKGNRFFVFPDDLSENKIEDDKGKEINSVTEVVKKGARRIQSLRQRKR